MTDKQHEQKAIAIAWAMVNSAVNHLQTGYSAGEGYSTYKESVIERLYLVKTMLDEMANEVGSWPTDK